MEGTNKGGVVFPGAGERTPSRSEYFTWINNTNEGATEAQTLVNLDFFRWLHDHHGMVLDIYAFDAGALDGPRNGYGQLDSPKFTRQFPRGFEPVARAAAGMGCRLGIWGGPDGFGETTNDALARIDLMASLCKPPLGFALFKFDGVCGTLRPEKAKYFVQMMEACRKHAPDLILLNHRLDLHEGLPHATTFLLGGLETYIDVSYCNAATCVHHRQGSLARGLPKLPDGRLTRMTEDHGVCISSFPDGWDDELVLQAFNRGLIIAPQVYGNPWFLRDDEFPKLARTWTLFRKYRDILVDGIELPASYGLHPVSRGDGRRRFLTLRNNAWDPIVIPVQLDASIGLDPSVTRVVVRRAHPHEFWLGEFRAGETIDVDVPPFHSLLLMVFDAAIDPFPEVTISGCEFDVVRDVAGAPVEVLLRGMPGTTASIELLAGPRQFITASIDGVPVAGLAGPGEKTPVQFHFDGEVLVHPWHRKLAVLDEVDVPPDAPVLFEAVAFAADNACLEVRAVKRSGKTSIPEVQACRDAFFNQPILEARGCWDRFAFDGDDTTIWHVGHDRFNCLRVDFGEVLPVERVRVVASGGDMLDRPIVARASPDLRTWHDLLAPGGTTRAMAVPLAGAPDMQRAHPRNLDERFEGEGVLGKHRLPPPPLPPAVIELGSPGTPVRYLVLDGTPDDVFEVNVMVDRAWLTGEQRARWHGTFTFESSKAIELVKAWSTTVTLPEIPPRAMLCVACEGVHGVEGIHAAITVNGMVTGTPDRAPAYQGTPWEHVIQNAPANYTYYFPLQEAWADQPIQITCIANEYYEGDCHPVAWITSWPDPLVDKKLVLV